MEHIPILGVAGWSGSGKTTLIEALLPELRRRGLRTAVIKQYGRTQLAIYTGWRRHNRHIFRYPRRHSGKPSTASSGGGGADDGR